MRCYRYMDYRFGIQSVLDAAFKVTNPDDFNDPFDCIGNVCGIPPKNSLVNFARTLQRPPSVTLDQVIEKLQRDFDLKLAASVQDRKSIGELYRVLCLSNADLADANSETLMWAHYADKGCGVRVVFELNPEELPLGCAIQSVKYSQDGRVPILLLSTMTDFPMCPELKDFYADCIITKGPSWEYEKEVRIVVGPDAIRTLKLSCGVELLSLPRTIIKGVDFGYKLSASRVRSAIEKLNAKGLNLTYRWAKFSGEKYEYDYWRMTSNGRWEREVC